jgi:hypothetical protein
MSTPHFGFLVCFPEEEIDQPHLTGKCCKCGIALAINPTTFNGPVPEETQTVCYKCIYRINPTRFALTEAQKKDLKVVEAFERLFGKVN